MIPNDILIQRGKLHLNRHSQDFFELLDDNFYSFLLAVMVLLEWVYQDGRLDALTDLERGLKENGRPYA